MRPPRNELGNGKRNKIVSKLLDDEIIRYTDIGCHKSKFGEGKIKTIHRKGDFVLQLAKVSLIQRRSIAYDKSTFAFVNILQLSQSPDALAPPRMKVRIRQFRDASNRIIGIAGKMPDGLRDDIL